MYYSQSPLPPGGTGARPRDVVALAPVLALAPLPTLLAVGAIRALDVALCALPSRAAGAAAVERVAGSAVQARAVVAAVFAPPARWAGWN